VNHTRVHGPSVHRVVARFSITVFDIVVAIAVVLVVLVNYPSSLVGAGAFGHTFHALREIL
jgi:preprotein translocase subunit SecG